MKREGTTNSLFGALNGFIHEAAIFYRLTARFVVDTVARHEVARRKASQQQAENLEDDGKTAVEEFISQTETLKTEITEPFDLDSCESQKEVHLQEPPRAALADSAKQSISPASEIEDEQQEGEVSSALSLSVRQAWSDNQVRTLFRKRLVDVLQDWELNALVSTSTSQDLLNTSQSILSELSRENTEIADGAARELILALRFVGLELPSAQSYEASLELDIQEFCKCRGIIHMVHFTRAENLPYIAKEGLLSNQRLAEMGRSVLDHERLDGKPDHVCASLSFPNYQMFFKCRQKQDSDWCVVLIAARVMWESSCLYYPYNAASADLSGRPSSEFSGVEALHNLFAGSVNGTNRHPALAHNMPTSPQAEVLVLGGISAANIVSVEFSSMDKVIEYRKLLNAASIGAAWSDRLFRPRCDWEQWRREK